MILVDIVSSALSHLAIDYCPRCLTGELFVDVARARFECGNRCADVAEAIGEAAARLTGELKGEGQTLAMVARKATRRTLEERYADACKDARSCSRLAVEIERSAAA
jgi:hypothetical protein